MRRNVTSQDMQDLAASRGGMFLSEEYKGLAAHYRWECSDGHQFSAIANNVKQGSWCRTCSSKLSERLCRSVFESIFGAAFPAVRPEWLRNRHGNRLELDGYCEKFEVAFEYQGVQHYEYVPFFHQSIEGLHKRQADDALKRKICERNGVRLIDVPHWIDLDELPKFVFEECKSRNLPVLANWLESQLDFSTAYSPKLLQQLQDLAVLKGGRRLSRIYKGVRYKHKWECAAGHTWKTNPTNIRSGSWCPTCAGKNYTIKEMRDIAIDRGGLCLSKRYVSAETHLQWECASCHKWSASWNTVKHGSWCPECAAERQRLGIKKVQEFARKLGGKCLSKTYKNNLQILQWQCALGHVWPARAANILRGDWCPDCAGNRKQTIEDMQSMATRLGGECLSSEYHNAFSTLLWRCAENHEFVKAPTAVQQGEWCSFCKGTRVHIQDMHDLAVVRGGRCLATKYHGMEQKLPWECAEGHQWDAVPGNVVRGRWCPTYGGVPPIFLADMKDFARSQGGECLSSAYTNMHTKLRWRCKEGHEWWAKPHNVKHLGQWCRKCHSFERFLAFKTRLEQVVAEKGGKILSGFSASNEKVSFRCSKAHEWKAIANNVIRGSWCMECHRELQRG